MVETPAQTQQQRGDALHHAVRAVEQHILGTAPALADRNFRIEDKRVMCVKGVHHEIDIYVTVDSAPGYSAIYIFECKNWKESVGKVEIIDFIEKIQCLDATHGYFVAKSFTKDARAQAVQCTKLSLLIATENDPVSLPIPGDFHTTVATPSQLELTFAQRGRKDDSKTVSIDVQTALAISNGVAISLTTYILAWQKKVVDKDILGVPTHRFAVGDHARAAISSRTFQPQELVLDGRDMESATIKVDYTISVHRPQILWSFDIETRGRVLSLAPVTLPSGAAITTHIGSGLPIGD